MFKYNSKIITVLFIIFVIFLIKNYLDDQKVMMEIKKNKEAQISKITLDPRVTDFNTAVVSAVNHEGSYGRLYDSKVKRMMISTRDQVTRGLIMGLLELNAVNALTYAVVWSLTGGVVTGVGEMIGWNPKLL